MRLPETEWDKDDCEGDIEGTNFCITPFDHVDKGSDDPATTLFSFISLPSSMDAVMVSMGMSGGWGCPVYNCLAMDGETDGRGEEVGYGGRGGESGVSGNRGGCCEEWEIDVEGFCLGNGG